MSDRTEFTVAFVVRGARNREWLNQAISDGDYSLLQELLYHAEIRGVYRA